MNENIEMKKRLTVGLGGAQNKKEKVMNTTTNINGSKPSRTNKTSTTVIIGFVTLLIGLFLGAASAETGSMPNLTRKAYPTNQISSSLSTGLGSLKAGGLQTWNPFQDIRDMQAQIDQSFDKMAEQFRANPQFTGFQDYPGYSLSLDVRDLKNRYEVQADLPDTKASDVHVTLQNGQTLNVQVDRKETQNSDQKNTAASMIELGQYDQTIQLPTPVKADQMKIQREGHELVITIPKAA
jgi:HSP20 family molecular chaperone IbpA